MTTPTDISICNQALQSIGTRSTIASLSENSNEARACNLLFNDTRDQVVGMHLWNFCRSTQILGLLKCAPGTPEFTGSATALWNPNYPAPPWLYEYRYPNDCEQMRYVTPQVANTLGTVPIFSADGLNYAAQWPGPCSKFVVAMDTALVRSITAITQASPGVITSAAHGFVNGDKVTISNITGMIELNGDTYFVAGKTTDTFTLTDLDGTAIDTTNFTTYTSGGYAQVEPIKVVLTNAQNALGTYSSLTAAGVSFGVWDSLSIRALVAALAGYLSQTLTGDKALSKMKFEEANSIIREARANDGNEGLTIQDVTPDWIRVRGLGGSPQGGAEAYGMYPPLFSVS